MLPDRGAPPDPTAGPAVTATATPDRGLHPDLLPVARLIPRSSLTARRLRLVRWLSGLRKAPHLPRLDDVITEDHAAPAPDGGRPVPVRVYRPAGVDHAVPALLWLHGGGFVLGDAYQDEKANLALVRELGIAVASVDYRLAPDEAFPAALDDGVAALHWLHGTADELGVRPDRIAVGGASAGGGLAAGVVLAAHDRGEVQVAFQLLVYPMLDDRTVTRPDLDDGPCRMWTATSNRFGWSAYLACEPGVDGVDPYAAPARREDLTGLPPAWIGVGTCDLFHDEDVAFADRLADAGVACELHVTPGGYHAFDLLQAKAGVSRAFRASYVEALRAALVDDRPG